MADSFEDDDQWLYANVPESSEGNERIDDENIFGSATGTGTGGDESSNLYEDAEIGENYPKMFDQKPSLPLEQSEDELSKFEAALAPVTGDDESFMMKINENDVFNQSIDENNDKEYNDKEYNDKEHDDDDDEDDDDDDDDDVQVTIGDIKSGSSFSYGGPVNLNIKRGTTFGAPQSSGVTKSKNIIDIEIVGTYNGVSIYDVNLDNLEEKPWRKPGADITDYFNYGFNEETWKLYSERQRKIRTDSNPNIQTPINVSKTQFAGANATASATPGKGADQPIPIASVNENSKYTGMGVTKKAGPPPGRKSSGTIDVIGGGTPAVPSVLPSRRPVETTKENFIQVISRPPGPPPPGMPGIPYPPMPGMPPFAFPPPGVEFPPGIPPPPGIPMLPNGQPMPFPPGDFPPMRFPHPGILPHPEMHFEEHGENFLEGRHDESRSESQDRESYHRSGRGYSREYRDDESYRSRSHYREHYDREHHERDYEHHERSRDREYDKEHDSTRRHRERDRDKDRDKDKSDHRDRESRDSSRRRHHEHEYDDDHSRLSSSSSSRHKHSKRSKRDKEDESEGKH